MSSGQFEVEVDCLRGNIGELRQQLYNLLTVKEQLEEKLQEISSMWEGQAKNAFHQQFNNQLTQLAVICKEVDEVFAGMDNAVKEYESCNNRVKDMVEAMRF